MCLTYATPKTNQLSHCGHWNFTEQFRHILSPKTTKVCHTLHSDIHARSECHLKLNKAVGIKGALLSSFALIGFEV